MAGNNLSLAIVVKLLTDNFTKGATRVKATLLTMQRNFLAFATAAGAGTLGLTNFLSRMVSVAKETSRANIALKNVSGTTGAFAENQKWLLDVAKRYGVEINALTSGFAKFKAAADISNMSLEDQRKIFESVARASVAFGLSAEDQRGIFMALSQMMSKNKVMAEELRLQMAERMPIAIQAMAKAAGVTVGELDALMKQGKVMSSDVLPRFADALNEMIADPDMNNLNKSLVDLSNTFQQMTKNLGIEDMFKRVVETATRALSMLANNVNKVVDTLKIALYGAFAKGLSSIWGGFSEDYERAVAAAVKSVEKAEPGIRRVEAAMQGLEIAQAKVAQAEGAYAREIAKRDRLIERQNKLSANAVVKRQRIEEQLVIANAKIAEKEIKVAQRKDAEKVASARLAAAQQKQIATASAEQQILAAQATATGWQRAMNKITYISGVAWRQLKSIFLTNIWSAAIAGVTALVAKLTDFVGLATKAKRAVKNLGDWDATDEMRELDSWREYLNHKDDDVRAGALNKINEMLGTQLSFEDDINAAIDHRLKLLAAEERLRTAQEALETAKRARDAIKNDSVTRKRRQEELVDPAIKEVADAREYYLSLGGKITSGDSSGGLTPTTPSTSPVKVEVVNLDLEDIGEGTAFDPKLQGEAMSNYFDKMAAQQGVQAIANRQRDRSGDWKLSNLEILEADQLFAQQKVDDLLNYAQQTGVELGNVLSEAISESTDLKQALGLAEKQDALSELQKEMNSLKFDLIEGGIQGIDGLVSAFERLSDAMEDDATAWEQIMAVWGIFESSAKAVMDTIQSVAAMSEMSAQIKRTTAAQNVASDTAEAAAETGKGVAKQAPGFAALVAVPTAIAAIVAAFAMIPKFANGGIVGGTSTHGDKILARLNSGEGVLTPEGLASLHDAANPRNARAVQVVGRLVGRGRDLVAVIDTENKYKTRTR